LSISDDSVFADPVAAIAALEAYDGVAFDADLVELLWDGGRDRIGRKLAAALPSFRHYQSDELPGCGGGAFPSFSITGAACTLGCAHCRAKILQPMIPATGPDTLDRLVRGMIEGQGMRGFLLSGGSNRRNEVPFDRFLPVVARLKRDFPALEIIAHTGLVDQARASRLSGAGVDVAMMDVIGADATIREVYRLDRPVADFAASLAALCATPISVVPHIVIGLHFGRLLGEAAALDIVADHPVQGLVLVVVMPHLAAPGSFAAPAPDAVGAFFAAARRRIPDRPILLGCARPAGRHRAALDAYAVLGGLDGIAFPADGAVALARALGRPVAAGGACCAVGCRR
jgi:lipoyl synthase